MIKNKIAIKLSLYFLAAILTFSLIIGFGFTFLFEDYISDFHTTDITYNAEAIAANLSKYMDGLEEVEIYDKLITFALDISVNNLWILDKHAHVIANNYGRRCEYDISDLSENQINYINEILSGKTVFSTDFKDIVPDAITTVGTPVTNDYGEIIGAVLLHTTINAKKASVQQTEQPLLISIFIALVITSFLSVFLSRRFTAPIINKEAEDALRLENTRREFVANISHELRTPIAVIRGSLETLINKIINTPAQIEDYYRQMLNEALLLERLVAELLDLAKLQNIEFVIEKNEISLNDVLSDVTRSSRLLAKNKSVRIEVTEENKDCVIYGDYGRIRQMLMIILDNAIKFSPQNSDVKIMLKENKLTVHDNGEGIHPKDLPYIFDKFYKTTNEQNESGTGLGLAIAKQIANRHEISLSVESKKGFGTTFTLKF